ncbi:uncharacterized protein LY79DRAFT_544757 [Colletotrichum navitas]|uniref:Uncharacterized protein n=1 Tax=Colletotrichum navitas TaxID=681940 RepID=A0AAD8Q743_9PEZI|nr:uncharacterized protein LY79DRAFT_544757 [Colletotrichum navitas]KAK1596412.1 hypothetical protein LY79DRAFT_544757 [Colletotrichum navitas]
MTRTGAAHASPDFTSLSTYPRKTLQAAHCELESRRVVSVSCVFWLGRRLSRCVCRDTPVFETSFLKMALSGGVEINRGWRDTGEAIHGTQMAVGRVRATPGGAKVDTGVLLWPQVPSFLREVAKIPRFSDMHKQRAYSVHPFGQSWRYVSGV